MVKYKVNCTQTFPHGDIQILCNDQIYRRRRFCYVSLCIFWKGRVYLRYPSWRPVPIWFLKREGALSRILKVCYRIVTWRQIRNFISFCCTWLIDLVFNRQDLELALVESYFLLLIHLSLIIRDMLWVWAWTSM